MVDGRDSAMTDLKAGLNGARVLVTGGAGLIGSRIGRVLAAHGAQAVALDRLDAYPFDQVEAFGSGDWYAEIIRGDVADPEAAGRAVAGADYVIHAAAYADVAACTYNAVESTRTNVSGTQVMLDAVIRERPRRFVFVSSASVYGNGPAPGTRQRWSETTPTDPVSVYANAKLWGEQQTRLQLGPAGIEHVSLRYFSVYGDPQVPKPRSHSWCVAWFGLQAALGLPLRLNGGGCQIRDFTHVDDIARATVRALVYPAAAGLAVNVGSGVPTSVAEVANLVAGPFPEARTVVVPGPEGDPLGGYADTTLMRRVLGFTPSITIDEGVRRYLDWMGSSGVVPAMAPHLVEDLPESAGALAGGTL